MTLKTILSLYRDPRFLTLLCLGFVSGLPFLLTLSTLSYWLSELGISKASMGFLMLLGLPYSFKFLLAPFLDHIRIPYLYQKLGQRRSWAILSLFGLMIFVFMLGWSNPQESLWITGIASFMISIFSSTLDTVIDAYRIELLPREKNAIGASVEAIGFRFGMMASGAGALYLAALWNWQAAYTIMAFCMVLGVIPVLYTKIDHLPRIHKMGPILNVFLESWRDLITQKTFLPLIAFIFCFKAPDIVMNAMSAPFFYEIGVSKVEFAEISKVYGIILMVVGAFTCGILLRFLGDLHGLILAIVLQAASSLMFVIQAIVGYNIDVLIIAVGVESFTSGLTSAVFIAYLSKFCTAPHTASHFTLLYSVGSLSRVITSAGSAYVAECLPWPLVFLLTACITIPGFYFLYKLEHKENTFLQRILKKAA